MARNSENSNNMKSSPQRMCIACRAMKDKRDLIRFVRLQGKVTVDRTFTAQGRGAYVCKNAECIAKMTKHKALSRAFGQEVPPEIYAEAAEAAND